MFRQSFKLIREFADLPRRNFVVLAASFAGAAVAEVTGVGLAVRTAVAAAGGGSGALTVAGRTFSATQVLVFALAAALTTVGLHVLSASRSSRIIARVVENVRVQSYDAFAGARWSAQANQREGSLQDSLTSVSNSIGNLTRGMTSFVSQVITLGIFIAAALSVEYIATLVFIGVGVLTIGILRPMARHARRASSSYVRAEREFADTASQVSASAMESRVFGVQNQVGKVIRKDAAALAVDARSTRFAVEVNGYLYKDLAIVFLVLVVAGIYLVTVASFAAVSVVIALLVRSISAAQQSNAQYQVIVEYGPHAEVANERICALRAAADNFGSDSLTGFGEMNFDQVSYTYDNSNVPAITGVTFKLRKGEVVGLSGPSGAGKSTIAQVALRLRLPTTGSVTVDGKDYASFAPDHWASAIGFVPQEPSLIEGTIRENISYFRDFSDGEIEAAARLANIHSAIMAMPAGYASPLGPRGSGLSGGQKQRLAIARALVGHPTLLVLDEPTSALDSVSEAAVVDAIGTLRQHCAVLVVTHRESTEAVCDRVIRVGDGQLMDRRQSVPDPVQLLEVTDGDEAASANRTV